MKRPTLADLGIKELRVWQHMSPSQINTFNTCARRWWFERRTPAPRDESESAQRGTLVHSILEEYMLTGSMPSVDHICGMLTRDEYALIREKYLSAESKWTTRSFAAQARKCACAVAVHLRTKPPVGPLSVEHGFRIKTPGLAVPVIGFIDMLHPEHRLITDYKVRSSRRYIAQEHKLLIDPQFRIYGALGPAMRAATREQQTEQDGGIISLLETPIFEDGEFQHLNVVWDSSEVIPVTVRYTAAQAENNWRLIEEFSQVMAGVAALDHPADVEPTVSEDSCFAYRKMCPFRECCILLGDIQRSNAEVSRNAPPRIDVDPNALMTYISDGATSGDTQEGQDMSTNPLLALMAAKAAEARAATAPAAPPPVEAPPPPKVEAAPAETPPKVESPPAEQTKPNEAPPGVNGVGGVAMDDDDVSAAEHASNQTGGSTGKGPHLPDGTRLGSAEITKPIAEKLRNELLAQLSPEQTVHAEAYLARLTKPNCVVKNVPYTLSSDASKTGHKVQIEAILRALAGDDVTLLTRYNLDYFAPPLGEVVVAKVVEDFESGTPAEVLNRICSRAKKGTSDQDIARQFWDIMDRTHPMGLTGDEQGALRVLTNEDPELQAALFPPDQDAADPDPVVEDKQDEARLAVEKLGTHLPLTATAIEAAVLLVGEVGPGLLSQLLPRIFDPGHITDKRLDDCGLNASALSIGCRRALAAMELPTEIQVNLSSLVDALAEQRKSNQTRLLATYKALAETPRVVTEAPPKPEVEAPKAEPKPERGPPGDVFRLLLLIGCTINTDHPRSLDELLRPMTQAIAKDMGIAYGCDQYNESGKRLGAMLNDKLDALFKSPDFVVGKGPYVFLVSPYRTDLPYIRAAFASRSDALVIEGGR